MNMEKPPGKCKFCGREMTSGGMSRHLQACPSRTERIREADQKTGEEEILCHLRVQNAWGGVYWLHLEMKGTATLGELDGYLRAIWLECCDHLSQFSFGGWKGRPIPMTRQIEQVLEPGEKLVHIYDFGTSSKTLVKVVDERMGKPLTENPIVLMARNNPPVLKCKKCGQPAKWICFECLYETEGGGLLCDRHAEQDEHREFADPVKLVNSPRTGVCGYTGPAEPPYRDLE